MLGCFSCILLYCCYFKHYVVLRVSLVQLNTTLLVSLATLKDQFQCLLSQISHCFHTDPLLLLFISHRTKSCAFLSSRYLLQSFEKVPSECLFMLDNSTGSSFNVLSDSKLQGRAKQVPLKCFPQHIIFLHIYINLQEHQEYKKEK